MKIHPVMRFPDMDIWVTAALMLCFVFIVIAQLYSPHRINETFRSFFSRPSKEQGRKITPDGVALFLAYILSSGIIMTYYFNSIHESATLSGAWVFVMIINLWLCFYLAKTAIIKI